MLQERTQSIENFQVNAQEISFSSLHYRFRGLPQRLGDSLLSRNKLCGALDEQALIDIDLVCQPFNSRPASLYTGINGYEPLLAFDQDQVRIEGLDFRGVIHLQPKLHGTLICNNLEAFDSPMVSENFLRMITAYALIDHGGLFMHSAAVVLAGVSYLFVGRSNAGKTTISRMALESGARVLSDDANVIQKSNNFSYVVDAVPFAGELGQQPVRPGGPYPLAGIFVLEKSDHNEVVQLSEPQQIAGLLVSSPVVNKDPYRNSVLFDNLQAIARRVPVARLKFINSQGFDEIYRCISNATMVTA